MSQRLAGLRRPPNKLRISLVLNTFVLNTPNGPECWAQSVPRLARARWRMMPVDCWLKVEVEICQSALNLARQTRPCCLQPYPVRQIPRARLFYGT
jgi:hypothetical protein